MRPVTTPLWHDVTIVNELGLHARAAARLAQVAGQASGEIDLVFGSERIDAKQVIDILTLAAGRGDTLRVVAGAERDRPVLNQIVALFADGFGE
jgi:phosphotransferase system HPr (HPr) family protein